MERELIVVAEWSNNRDKSLSYSTRWVRVQGASPL